MVFDTNERIERNAGLDALKSAAERNKAITQAMRDASSLKDQCVGLGIPLKVRENIGNMTDTMTKAGQALDEYKALAPKLQVELRCMRMSFENNMMDIGAAARAATDVFNTARIVLGFGVAVLVLIVLVWLVLYIKQFLVG